MNSSKTYLAPAKINLFLHVCGKREDGYHNLQTAFQFLNLADSLTFTINNDGFASLSESMGDIADSDNLIIRAAHLLTPFKANAEMGASIAINKQLPMGAGLGGGSSNAATTLVALNELWQCGLSREKLQQLGVSLGADVPIFIFGHAAFAEGIGEKLDKIEPIEDYYLLAMPNCHVSTGKIFSHSQLTRDSKMKKIAAFLEQGKIHKFQETRNDCEALVKSLYPEVAEVFKQLKAIENIAKQPARMTGTGACVFAAFDSEEKALSAKQQLAKSYPELNSTVCKGENISPLYQ